MGLSKLERHMQVFIGFVLIFTAPFCVGLTDLEDVMAINGLYVALGYPPLQGWLLVGGDPCGDKWEGVECVFSNITSIKLSNAQLGGGLGESLQFFGSVIEMDFSNNGIGGSIPPSLPPTLRNLSLSGNQLTGSIPPSLSSLTQLLDLSLANNLLVGPIPDAFQQYTSLANLDLSGNNLSGQLPPSMGNLSSLSTLHLQNNQLTGVLDVLQDLPLQDLNIENNQFSGPVPAKLLGIPNFRKDRNPFNTTVILSPQAAPQAAPPQSIALAPSSGEPNWRRAKGPSSSINMKSEESKRSLTSRAITWIAVGGISLVIALLLCFLLSRCVKTKRLDRKDKKHYFDGLNGSSEKPKYNESSPQQLSQMEAGIPKESGVRPLESYGAVNRKMGSLPKRQDEQAKAVKRTAESSTYEKDSEIDMTDTEEDFLPPPPPPPPFPIDNAIINPVVPAIATASGRHLRNQNTNSSRVFTVSSLQQYTNSFSQENFVGAGMLGNVYRAELPDGKLLAVKNLDKTACRQQSDEEFLELVSTISKLRHANIVELVGYCAEHGQRVLVYEYCTNGTLHDALNLHDEIHQKLTWHRRIQLAIGAARALEYLHQVCQPPIMHRNFKSANLLLDDKLGVQVSDCGLAPLLFSASMSARFENYGSGAPESESGIYTYQSDVYSFGVVLLELLTGRKSFDRSRPRGEQSLVRWAIPKLHDIDALSRMVDPSLHGALSMKSLSRFADIISSCIQPEPEFRPPISDIVRELLQMI